MTLPTPDRRQGPSDLSLLKSLDLRRLAILREVARGGSFAAAASALSFTPSAISQQMAGLERDTGAELFRRTSRGMALTEAGQALASRAESVLAQVVTAGRELDAIVEARTGRVRLGSFTSATSTFAAAGVQSFRELHPKVEIQFVDAEPYESAARLKARQLDLAVIFELDHWPAGFDYHGNRLCADDDLTCVELFDDPFVVVLPRNHRLAPNESLAFEQIASEPILGTAPWISDLLDAAGRDGVELLIDSSCSGTGFEALQAFVAAGRGLTLMPRLATGWLRESLTYRALDARLARQVKIATLASAPPSAITAAMQDSLVAAAAAYESLPSGA